MQTGRSFGITACALWFAWLAGCGSEALEPSLQGPATPAGKAAASAPDGELGYDAVDVTIPATSPPGQGSDGEKRMGLAAAAVTTTVYLHRGGGTFSPGYDDPAQGKSSVLTYYGLGDVVMPASSYTDAQWTDLLTRVRAYFTPFNVAITDARPVGGPYIELAIGATYGSVLGLSNNITGIAPMGTCRVVTQAVGFVFTSLHDQPGYGGIAGAAETVAHEIGHTLSLSHEQLSTDLMSYAPRSSLKRFQDEAAACGTSSTAVEACTCGAATQNSHRQLLTMVGAHVTAPPPPPPSSDTQPPTVTLVSPSERATPPGNAYLEVSVDATDNVGVASVELYWQFNNRLMACNDSVAGTTCTRAGARRTWRINVGTGERKFHAIAKDAAGNQKQSPTRTIQLGGAVTPPAPVDAKPTVAALLPAMNKVFLPGEQVTFQARAADDVGVADVRAVWSYPGGSLEYPMTQTSTPGVYQAATSVSNTAASGPRTITFYAVDTTGQRTTAAAVTVSVP